MRHCLTRSGTWRSHMCQVVPSDGPRMRTGASSGPSKRYWRAGVFVSLTAPTLTAFSYVSDPGPLHPTPGSRTSPPHSHTAFTGCGTAGAEIRARARMRSGGTVRAPTDGREGAKAVRVRRYGHEADRSARAAWDMGAGGSQVGRGAPAPAGGRGGRVGGAAGPTAARPPRGRPATTPPRTGGAGAG